MSFATQYNRVKQNIADAYSAIENRGGGADALTRNSENLATAIDTIPSGIDINGIIEEYEVGENIEAGDMIGIKTNLVSIASQYSTIYANTASQNTLFPIGKKYVLAYDNGQSSQFQIYKFTFSENNEVLSCSPFGSCFDNPHSYNQSKTYFQITDTIFGSVVPYNNNYGYINIFSINEDNGEITLLYSDILRDLGAISPIDIITLNAHQILINNNDNTYNSSGLYYIGILNFKDDYSAIVKQSSTQQNTSNRIVKTNDFLFNLGGYNMSINDNLEITFTPIESNDLSGISFDSITHSIGTNDNTIYYMQQANFTNQSNSFYFPAISVIEGKENSINIIKKVFGSSFTGIIPFYCTRDIFGCINSGVLSIMKLMGDQLVLLNRYTFPSSNSIFFDKQKEIFLMTYSQNSSYNYAYYISNIEINNKYLYKDYSILTGIAAESGTAGDTIQVYVPSTN